MSLYALVFQMFESIIYRVTQLFVFHKWLIRSIQCRYFVHLYVHAMDSQCSLDY